MRAEEQRVRRLQSEGRITRLEADEIVAALDQLVTRSRSARVRAGRFRRDLSPAGVLKARFLVGEISREELDRGFRRITVTMCVMMALVFFGFGLLINFTDDLFADYFFAPGDERSMSLFWTVTMMGIIGVGGSYYNQLKRSSRRLWRLRRKLDISRPELPQRRPGHCASCGSENQQRPLMRALSSAGWVLLPWIAIRELYLGQRLPRRYERCRSCEAISVECPSCQASVESLDWAVASPFWAQRSMQCKHCGAELPCWRNVFALLIQWPARAVARLLGRKLNAQQTPLEGAR